MNELNQELSGRVVWITGGSSGIGQHCAFLLAAEGAKVIISGRRAQAIQETIDQHPELRIEGAVLDVADRDSVYRVAQEILQRHGRIDILVNSAGVNVANRSWSTLDTDDFDRVMQVNLKGSMYCTLAVLGSMRARQDGLVIHIASWAGRHVSALTGPSYTAAKHAVVAMSQSLNVEECVNGIRSTAILPGEVATPIMQSRAVPPTKQELSLMLQPEQVAQTVRMVALMPATVCVNEILISPRWNRSYPSVQARLREMQIKGAMQSKDI